jgi:HD-like signal output (HDOD) protein
MASGQSDPAPFRSPARQAVRPPAPVALNLGSVPVFAPVAIQLLSIVSQENVGLSKLAGLIRADPGVSVEMLRLANSPLFGARSEITGILHALAMLGLNRIKAIVMTVAIRDFLSPARDVAVFAPCWRHCLATAFVAEEIATHAREDPDICYTAGLLHAIGQMALIAARPAEYDGVVRIAHESDRDLRELEREWFGVDRGDLAARLAEAWNLPHELRAIVSGEAPQGAVGEVVRTACTMAGTMGFRLGPGDAAWDLDSLALPSTLAHQLPEMLNDLVASIATKINAVECSLVMV